MTLGSLRAWILLAVFVPVLHLHAVHERGLSNPLMTADSVMARVRVNVRQYEKSIPNFICDESVDSTITANGKIKEQMKVLDSLEVERTGNGDDLNEARLYTLVDGNMPRNQKVRLPYAYSGGFATLLYAVNDTCLDFDFAAHSPQDRTKPYVLVSHLKPDTASVPSFCRNRFHAKSGRQVVISVDPQSFQIERMEFTLENLSFGAAAHLPFVPAPTPPNQMITVVEYGNTLVGGETFSLPTSLTSTITGTKNKKPLILAYRAQYANYRRFASTATMVPQ